MADLWDSPHMHALVRDCRVGPLVRAGRTAKGMRQADLGLLIGYSQSAVSRLETGQGKDDLAKLRAAAVAVGMPPRVLAAVLGVTEPLPARVVVTAERRDEEEPMRRRSLLAGSLAAVPGALLVGVDNALATIPTTTGGPAGSVDVLQWLGRARASYDAGDHARLIAAMPDLLATAHTAAQEAVDEGALSRLAACYDLCAQTMSKLGRYSAARSAADRATVYAHQSGAPLAQAASARMLGIVLRHQGQGAIAQRITLEAAARVERTGLRTPEQAATYAQMLCTCAYTAAGSEDRGTALELMRDARRAAARIPERLAGNDAVKITSASVTLYEVGVHWALGDAGAAVHASRDLTSRHFDTPERRGRFHTDMARSWWLWGKPDQTVAALMEALREAPAEVRNRPSMRALTHDLAQRHPRAVGVKELVRAVGV
ncbi:helix-turn-helix transcriptional regulator [Streptomyces sp. SID3343]|uniref:helix-turn-helix domain-containing protein n=1 Tax=Streptomyces sp. SID3343 TaxID=2690260 RepID=UPI001371686B|nr:helix-turn-helix transcriptional regulator [Streptomyces sp. SID3343]MYV99057.1 helix-turn-helix domain-containing protein [Streptomyces sp. SID3343]